MPTYTFVPWVRRGIGSRIDQRDHLGKTPDAGPAGRATIDVELAITHVPVDGGAPGAPSAVHRTVELVGPGDVAAVLGAAIVRTVPFDGARDATPGELAFVEFYEEDFPWRYTPARPAGDADPAADRHKLRPWLALLVLAEGEFELIRRADDLPLLHLSGAAKLPPATELWAWAHAQLAEALRSPADLDAAVAARPDRALSRLLSPRRLASGVAYTAFLVPAFETGRLAGLGLPLDGVPAQKPSWGTAAATQDPRWPVYHRFSFTVGDQESFEDLARALEPFTEGGGLGGRAMSVSLEGFASDTAPGAPVAMEGSLAGSDFAPEAYGSFDPRPGVLHAAVDRAAATNELDPMIVPPAYGRWHADVARVTDAAGSPVDWVAELNGDPRHRAAAGLGARIVQERQEELVARAWEQVGHLREANQRLREAELARAAGQALFRKHLVTAMDGSGDRLLILTASAQSGIAVPGGTRSIRAAVNESLVPGAAQAPAFRRITRPRRPAMRRVSGGKDASSFQSGLLSRMNAEVDALSTAPAVPAPAPSVRVSDIHAAATAARARMESEATSPRQEFLELLRADLVSRHGPGGVLVPALDTLREELGSAVTARFPEGGAVADEVQELVTAIREVVAIGSSAARVALVTDVFEGTFGKEIAGKEYSGVTVVPESPPAGKTVARATSLDAVKDFAEAVGEFSTFLDRVPPPETAGLLQQGLAGHVLERLAPRSSVRERVVAGLPGLRQVLAARPAADPRPLRPVAAYPTFPDPLVESLSRISQEYVVPGLGKLPPDSVTVLVPNRRFIESLLAGANHALAQELLWREFPTDQRGTYFRVFWDRRDALDAPDTTDLPEMTAWTGALGSAPSGSAGMLVLAVRGRLLRKFPGTLIFAQRAAWSGAPGTRPRVLAPGGEVRWPVFTTRLEPDVTLLAFRLPVEEARGTAAPPDPGWFFVFMERPGEVRFGLDASRPPGGLGTWNDLWWGALASPDAPHVLVEENAGLAPSTPASAVFGRSSADMASILLQSPVLLARHAEELIP